MKSVTNLAAWKHAHVTCSLPKEQIISRIKQHCFMAPEDAVEYADEIIRSGGNCAGYAIYDDELVLAIDCITSRNSRISLFYPYELELDSYGDPDKILWVPWTYDGICSYNNYEPILCGAVRLKSDRAYDLTKWLLDNWFGSGAMSVLADTIAINLATEKHKVIGVKIVDDCTLVEVQINGQQILIPREFLTVECYSQNSRQQLIRGEKYDHNYPWKLYEYPC